MKRILGIKVHIFLLRRFGHSVLSVFTHKLMNNRVFFLYLDRVDPVFGSLGNNDQLIAYKFGSIE